MSIIDYGKRVIESCVQNGITQETIKFIEEFAKYLNGKPWEINNNLRGNGVEEKETLSTSQIRNVFNAIKKLEQKGFNEQEFILLKPRLVYTKARGKKATKDFVEVIMHGVDKVMENNEKATAFKNFFNFFESLLCYHKSEGK